MTVDRPFEGNQSKQMPGTCEACVWGRGEHNHALVRPCGDPPTGIFSPGGLLNPKRTSDKIDKLSKNLSINNGKIRPR